MVAFSSPIDTGLPGSPSAAIPDELYEEISKIYNAIRILQQKFGTYNGLEVLDPSRYINELAPIFSDSIQVHRMQPILVKASVTIAAGELANLFLSGGVIQARKSDASAIGTRAWGWAPNAIAAADMGIIYLQGGWNGGFGGLTIGATYYVSATTPGGISTTAPVAVGTIRQEVGIALSATDLYVRISTPIVN